MPTATGTFEITSAGEDPFHERGGEPKLARAHGTQRFGGDIEGDGIVEWLNCYVPRGTARLIGLQRIDGTIHGRKGSVVIEVLADHDGRESRGTWAIVSGSGAGELTAIAGTGSFEARGGPTVSYRLDYELG